MSYKHGIYGAVEASNGSTDIAQATIPAYIGSAPIQRMNATGKDEFNYSDFINKPIVVSSLREVNELGLYSDDWNTYTLCEAIHAHFMNGDRAVAPIVLINVMNPETDVKDSATTASVIMKKSGNKFVGTIADPLCKLDGITLTATGATLSEVNSRYAGDSVVIEATASFTSGSQNTFTATATYTQIDFSASGFTAENITAALGSLDYCEQLTGVIPNVLAAPVISENPEFHSLMIQKAMDKIAGKWNFVCLSDIPVASEGGAKTYEEAIAWKNTNAYDSKYDKVYWPAVACDDKVYHLSTIGAYMMQNIDNQNGEIPYVSTSNKPLFCDRAVVGEKEPLLISEEKANALNQVGITTVNSIKRTLRMWGAHMANYNHSQLGNIKDEDKFDTSIRMGGFILNHMQNQYINEIDQSFSRKDIDSVINSAQTWLDSLVNDGALYYAAISFNDDSNPDESIANGDFVFDLAVTYSVVAKSITFKLQYTSAGLSVLTSDGGEA